MRTVCSKHENGDPGSLACWGCEVERLRKLVPQRDELVKDGIELAILLNKEIADLKGKRIDDNDIIGHLQKALDKALTRGN